MLVAVYRPPKMLKPALCAALGARQRTESRAAHYRDRLNRSITTRPGEQATLPRLDYENIDVGAMELPPQTQIAFLRR